MKMTTMEKVIAYQKIALSTTALLFGISAIIHTTTPTTAASPNTTYSTGKYAMQMNTAVFNESFYWYILVWDTETGTSKMYQTNSKSSSGFTCPGSKYAPPSNPL